MSLASRAQPIAAIATAAGRGAVGIVRASGRDLTALIDAIIGQPLAARQAHYTAFRAADGQPIDHGLALYFPAPHSYTGEDVLELQAHGGPVVLQLLLARCLEAGAGVRLRLAEPGEFTERAFLNGKLDLSQAEAVADLIDASTEAAARSASRALAGIFSNEINNLSGHLVTLRAFIEATLDFPEDDIDVLERPGVCGPLAQTIAALNRLLAQARQGALLRDGLRVVLAGQPNAGKSSLFNALAGAELAIVTPIAGTTRDRISQTIQIEGVPIHVTDTAGVRPDGHAASDDVERIGMARSWQAIESADAVVFLHDLTRLGDTAVQAADAQIAQRLAGLAPQRVLQVFNKADLAPAAHLPEGALRLSAHTGEGLPQLRRALLERAGWRAAPEGVFIARARHVEALQTAAAHAQHAADLATSADAPLELLAEELRLAHRALQTITGQYSADELLGDIFARFCIGK